MSKLKAFTVYDSKAEAYLAPFFTQSRGLALRSFTDAVNTKDHSFNRYPSDFTLFEIGEFDEEAGRLVPHQALVSLGVAVEFLRPAELGVGQLALEAMREKLTAGGSE